jgi:hypothetical protein
MRAKNAISIPKRVLAIVGALLATSGAFGSASPRADDAIASLAKVYDTHALIFMGEWHRNVQQHVFLRALVDDPRFLCRVDDIVVEFGNAHFQPTADAYIAGKDVAEADVKRMYRETAVPFAWNAPMYRAFFDAVRAANLRHECAHPVRVVLGDPPIDWSRIHTAADYAPFADRDVAFATSVDREVLAKHHRALLIEGTPHAVRGQPDRAADGNEGKPDPTAAQLIAKAHPGTLFSVALVTTADAAKTLKMGAPPSFRRVHGSDLEHADFLPIAPEWNATPAVIDGRHTWKLDPADAWPPMGQVVDGLVYLGGDATRAFPSPSIYLDAQYQRELRARIAILNTAIGQDFGPMFDDLIHDAEQERAAPAKP